MAYGAGARTAVLAAVGASSAAGVVGGAVAGVAVVALTCGAGTGLEGRAAAKAVALPFAEVGKTAAEAYAGAAPLAIKVAVLGAGAGAAGRAGLERFYLTRAVAGLGVDLGLSGRLFVKSLPEGWRFGVCRLCTAWLPFSRSLAGCLWCRSGKPSGCLGWTC